MVDENNSSASGKEFVPEEYGNRRLANSTSDGNDYKSQSNPRVQNNIKDETDVCKSIHVNDPNNENRNGDELGDPIEFIMGVISKEVKDDDKLVRQIFYTMLSSAAKNPTNLAINAPTGEGKSYGLHKVGSLFSDDVVIFLSGMSDKALFHRKGMIVVKGADGEYFSLRLLLRGIDSRLEKIKNQKKNTQNSGRIDELNAEADELEKEKEKLKNDAVKLIDLTGKVLIFMDTPREELFSALMPLLSHDKYETTYEFVDKNEGITTNTNILRGWPSFIFSQAIDFSGYERAEEIQRRFLISNPKMDIEKYKKAADLITLKYSIPDEIYQDQVVSDKEREKAKQLVAQILENIQKLSQATKPNRNNIIIPFVQTVRNSLNITKALDMTSTERIFNCLSLLPIINSHKRPKLVIQNSKDKSDTVIQFALFQDLQETLYLMENTSGVRPFVMEWFEKVFMAAFQGKKIPDSKMRGEIRITETREAVTSEQIAQKHKEVYGKTLRSKQILQSYLYPLMNNGLIDRIMSEIDKRAKIYFPINTEKNILLFQNEERNNLLQNYKLKVGNPTTIPTKEYISYQIQSILNYYSQSSKKFSLKNHKDEEITLEQLVDEYYISPSDYFIGDETVMEDSISNIQNPTICGKEHILEEYPKTPQILNNSQLNQNTAINSIESLEKNPNQLFQNKEKNNILHLDESKNTNIDEELDPFEKSAKDYEDWLKRTSARDYEDWLKMNKNKTLPDATNEPPEIRDPFLDEFNKLRDEED